MTATSAYGMNGEANLTFDGSQLVVQGGSGTQHMFRHSAGWGGVTTYLDNDKNLRGKKEILVAMSGITTGNPESYPPE